MTDWIVTRSGFDEKGTVVIVETDPPTTCCPICESRCFLRADGRLRRHNLPDASQRCMGHGQKPLPLPRWHAVPPARKLGMPRKPEVVGQRPLNPGRIAAQVDMPGFELEVRESGGAYTVIVNGLVRHPDADAETAMRALTHYLGAYVYKTLTPAQKQKVMG